MPTLVLKNSELGFTYRYPFREQLGIGKTLDLTSLSKKKLWEVWIEGSKGDFDPADSYEVSVGYEPDIVFASHPFFSDDSVVRLEVEKGKGKQPKIRAELFAQTFGNTNLFLRRYRADNSAVVLLRVPIINTVPDEKKDLFDALTKFFYQNAHGYFLIDSVLGQTEDKVSQEFHFGYSSFNDPERELFSIEQILTTDFRIALLSILRNPEEQFADIDCPRRLSKVRKISPHTFRRTDLTENDNPTIWASVRTPSFETPTNNVISTFLETLLRRINVIASYFGSQKKAIGGVGKKDWERSQDARFDSASTAILNRCAKMRNQILPFLASRVFAVSERRHESIFRVFPFAHIKSPSYRFILNQIHKYALTNFYWTGDPSPLFRQPAYVHADDGSTTWIRKYSMLYEFWCYMRLHQVFRELNFSTDDVPKNGRMQVTSYVKDPLKIVMYHDIGTTDKNIPIELECGGKTPDFALVFENQQTRKLALVILDAKSNSNFAEHIPTKRNNYLNHCRLPEGSEQSSRLKMKQSWILLSGEDCSSFERSIECPPTGTMDLKTAKMLKQITSPIDEPIDELSCDGTDDSFRKRTVRSWLAGLNWSSSKFVAIPDKNQMYWGAGYLFTHIKRKGSVEDSEETDRFKLFLEAQIKLMETILA